MKQKYLTISLLIVIAALVGAIVLSNSKHLKTSGDNQVELIENQKIKITDNYHLIYSFSEKPKVGTIMFKAALYDKRGSKTIGPRIVINYDMPSMRGHHPSGDVTLTSNRNHDYIAPVHLVMRGDWEITIRIFEEDKEVYFGKILFNI